MVESGFGGLILRPLSAKQLPPTIPEEKGWVKRDELMGISGRSRKPQMELAEKFGFATYPSPAGGCLLTDPIFSRRLRDLLSSKSHPEVREFQLLKLGRHFRIGPRTKLVVGRNKEENDTLLSRLVIGTGQPSLQMLNQVLDDQLMQPVWHGQHLNMSIHQFNEVSRFQREELLFSPFPLDRKKSGHFPSWLAGP